MVEQWATAVVVVFAVGYAVFQTQPAPPQSPLLYQWETMHAYRTKYRDHEIFYKDVDGSVNNSETLLVLHGFPTSSFDFHLVLSSLRKVFNRIIFVDFLGHGFSDKPRTYPYTLLEQANIVQHVLGECSVSQIHILSHDYGGSVAFELLTRLRFNPAGAGFTIKSLAVISANIFPEAYKETWNMYLLRMPVIGFIAARFANRVSYAKELDHMFGSRKVDEATLKQLWFFARYREEYRAWPSILDFINERRKFEKRWAETLQEEEVPTCFIHGPADRVALHQGLKGKHPERFKHISIELLSENIGHYPQLEAPDELLEKYTFFLKSKLGLTLAETRTIILMPQQLLKPSAVSS